MIIPVYLNGKLHHSISNTDLPPNMRIVCYDKNGNLVDDFQHADRVVPVVKIDKRIFYSEELKQQRCNIHYLGPHGEILYAMTGTVKESK
jgi:hypothetical protein